MSTTLAPSNSAVARSPDAEKWGTLTDALRHFHLDYPAEWEANTEEINREHYTLVFAALNSARKKGFTIAEVQTGPKTWQLSGDLIAKQLPRGTAYIDISWDEGTEIAGAGPLVVEMDEPDLSALLKENHEWQSGDLIGRSIYFVKWGHQWNITVFMRSPVTSAMRNTVQKILESFRFDGAPPADVMSVIQLAAKYLPADADPEKYNRPGGSSEYYCGVIANGGSFVVTFTKHLEDNPPKSWTYLVHGNGEVIPVPPKRP